MTKSTTTAQIYANQINKLNWQRQQGKISAEEYKASVEGIIVAEQAATTATRTLTTAFKLVGNILLSLALDWLITKIQEASRAEEEARQNAETVAKSFLNEADALKSLRKEYDNIISSNDDESKKNEQLIEWKKKLVEQYGFEEDAINRVTKARETGFEAIDKEMYENAKKQISELGDEYDKAVKAMESAYTGYFQNGIFDPHENRYTQIEVETLKNFNISTKMQYGTSTGYTATLSYGEDLVTSIENISNAINYFRGLTRDLSDSEKRLLGDLQSDYSRLTGIQKDYETQYSAGMQAYAQKAFYEFTHDAKNLQNSIENVTAETYEVWKENLLALAGDSEPLKELLLSFANDYFPQFADGVKEATGKTGTYSVSTKQKLDDLTTSLDGVYDSFDTAFSNQSTIQSAFDKIQSGTDLTTSEMKSLIKLCKNDFPEIGTLFTKTAKGWTISSDDLIRANNALMKSTKETVQQQIDGYNEVIRAYENRFVTIPKGGQTIQVETDVGISEEEYKNATEQVENLKKVLETLGLVLDNDADKTEQFTKTLKTLSTNISTGVSAQKEMNENGKISASTLESLLSLGDDYIKCITVENGIIKFNADIFKEVTKAKLDDEIATLKLAQAEAIHARIEDAQYNKGKEGAKLQAIIDETNLKLKAAQALRDGLDETWDNELKDNSGSSNDPIKEAFEKDMKDIEHLHNMGLKSDEEYYDALEKANEKHYKNSAEHESDYFSNVEKIYKGRQSLYKDNADKQFDELEDQLKSGKISAEAYAKALNDLGQSLWGEDTLYAGTETATKELESVNKKVKELTDDIYSERYEALEKANDKTIKGEKNFVHEWSKLANETYREFDPKKWTEEYSKISDYTQNYYKDLLDKGLLNPEQYRQKITDFFEKLKSMGVDLGANWLADALGQLSESDYLDAWDKENGYDSADSKRKYKLRAARVKYIYDLAEQLYGKNGQDNVKAYNELIKQGLEEEKSIWEDRVNDEKTFWEQQKQNVEDSYDTEIDKLKDVQDEEKKLKDIEEKRLAVIKARQKLEDAKKQKNQLIFEGGTFKYDVNQDDILSAEEELANAIEALRDEELNTQIEILEEQKNAAVDFYEQIIKKIDEYLDKENKILNSDTEVLDTVLATDTEVDTSKSNFDAKKFIENGFTAESFINAFKGAIFSKEAIANMIESFKATRIGTVPANTTTSTATNNSSTTNNAKTVIKIEKIFETLNMPQGTTKEQVEAFFKSLNNAILQRIPKVLVDVRQ